MSKNSYVNANLISTYDTFANWLTKTNDIIYDMGTSVVTTNSSATPDITTGNGYVNGFFGSNTFYVFTALHGGTPTALANLNITSNLYISSNTTVAANLVVIGTANVTVNLNSVGIVANNITANNNLIVTNTAVLNTATAVIANIATANIATLGVTGTGTVLNLNVTNVANLNNANVVSANITTLGVTGLATFVNASVGTGTSNVQANTTQIRISNPSAVATVNATTFSGTAANATNLNSQPGSFYTNASNINAGNLPWAHVAANTVNTTGAFTITGVYTHNANIVVNTANHLVVGNATVNATANQTTFYVANSTTNTSINPGIITFGGGATVNNTVYSGTANNSLALAGYIANNAVPSDGFVLAWNQAESRIKWTNPSGISTALNSNAIVANASLQAGSNGTVFVLTAEGNTTSTNLVMRANNISLTVDSGAVLFNSNAFVNSAVLSVGNTTANVTVNTTVITVGNSSVNATINSTAFSRQANGATNLGPEGSGVNLSTLQTQITGNAATAYANAVANSANAGNITTGTLDAGRLPATVVNTSGAFTITGVHTHNANIFMNTASQILIGTASVNAVANQTTLAIYNASSNVVANATTIVVGGTATINSTAFSRQANGATNFGPEGSGVNLSTLQSQITGNASTAYTNAVANSANATNITTGTLDAGRLPSTIVNTSASFTLAGDMIYSGTARFNANVGFNVAPGTSSSRFNVVFPATVNSTDVLLVQKTRDSANAARYGFTDVGGLTGDSNGGAFWRGFHFAAPSITDGAAVAQFPRFAIAAETNSLSNPSTRRWLLEAGNDSATSRYSIALRTASSDRLVIEGSGLVDIVSKTRAQTGFDSVTRDDISVRTSGGFWQTNTPTHAEGWPSNDGVTWHHMFCSTHSNDSNYYSMQFAGNFNNSNDIYYRSISLSGTTGATNTAYPWRKIWHDGNDGSGSGLDADLLDGLNSGAFLRSDTQTTWNGSATGAFRITCPAGASGTSGTLINSLEVWQPTLNADATITLHVGSDFACHFGLDGTTNDLFVGGWSFGAVKYKVWHAGNDGTTSGLDADLLDGLHASTGQAINTIVARDNNGYIYTNYINSNTNETENPSINSLITSNGDGFYRKASKAHVVSQLGVASLSGASFTGAVSGRINPRISSAADGSISPDISAADQYNRTALAAACTINAPTGTPVNGNRLMFRLRDNGTARALTWNGTYRAVGVTLPTTTTASKTTYVGCVFNSDENFWDVIAVSTQA